LRLAEKVDKISRPRKIVFLFANHYFARRRDGKTTSFPGSFPWLGGGAPRPQTREKTLGTRLTEGIFPS